MLGIARLLWYNRLSLAVPAIHVVASNIDLVVAPDQAVMDCLGGCPTQLYEACWAIGVQLAWFFAYLCLFLLLKQHPRYQSEIGLRLIYLIVLLAALKAFLNEVVSAFGWASPYWSNVVGENNLMFDWGFVLVALVWVLLHVDRWRVDLLAGIPYDSSKVLVGAVVPKTWLQFAFVVATRSPVTSMAVFCDGMVGKMSKKHGKFVFREVHPAELGRYVFKKLPVEKQALKNYCQQRHNERKPFQVFREN